MNKNKIILIIILAIIFLLIGILVINMKWTENSSGKKIVRAYKIWIVWDDTSKFETFLADFKKTSWYSSTQFLVESFPNFEDYYYSLASAMTRWEAPDMFVLNNNEKSLFEEQVLWIWPSIITPSNFRKNFKRIFWDELIVTTKDWDKGVEFLKWIPIWYETLGIYYNRKYIVSKDLTSLSSLSNVVSKLKKKNPSVIPIWMWNGTTVYGSNDIITQFFLLEDGVTWINNLSSNQLKSALSTYMMYWGKYWDNNYNSSFDSLKYSWKNNLDLFTEGKTFMVVWYPRLLNEIEKRWYSKAYLEASVFPHYSPTKWKSLINYNYFVLNKDSANKELWFELLQYMSSEKWAKEYLSVFPYYLPSQISLERDLLENKVSERFNVLLKDFYKFEHELGSFDKWVASIYNKDIKRVLDDSTNYISQYESLSKKLLCKKEKFLTLKNPSVSCE